MSAKIDALLWATVFTVLILAQGPHVWHLTAHVTDKSNMKTGSRCFHMSFGEHL